MLSVRLVGNQVLLASTLQIYRFRFVGRKYKTTSEKPFPWNLLADLTAKTRRKGQHHENLFTGCLLLNHQWTLILEFLSNMYKENSSPSQRAQISSEQKITYQWQKKQHCPIEPIHNSHQNYQDSTKNWTTSNLPK